MADFFLATLALLSFSYLFFFIYSKWMVDMPLKDAIKTIVLAKGTVKVKHCYLNMTSKGESFYLLQLDNHGDFVWEHRYQNLDDAIEKFFDLTDFGI